MKPRPLLLRPAINVFCIMRAHAHIVHAVYTAVQYSSCTVCIELLASWALPAYIAKSTGVDPAVNVLDWWRGNSPELPRWSSAAQRVFLIQPSSTAAERVFSILNNTFTDSQTNSLEDYVEAIYCYATIQ